MQGTQLEYWASTQILAFAQQTTKIAINLRAQLQALWSRFKTSVGMAICINIVWFDNTGFCCLSGRFVPLHCQ
jgi:hypothetical protein